MGDEQSKPKEEEKPKETKGFWGKSKKVEGKAEGK